MKEEFISLITDLRLCVSHVFSLEKFSIFVNRVDNTMRKRERELNLLLTQGTKMISIGHHDISIYLVYKKRILNICNISVVYNI